MDSSRCVVIEIESQNEIPLLRYLRKNEKLYNWLFGEADKTQVCVWWMKNVEFSKTPLRSFLKRLKSKTIKESGRSHLKISRKMSTKDGITKVYSILNLYAQYGVLRNNSRNTLDYVHLDKSVREVIIEEFSLFSNDPGSSEREEETEIKEPDSKIKEPKIEEPKIDSNKANISTKLDLMMTIITEVKKLLEENTEELTFDVEDDKLPEDDETDMKEDTFDVEDFYQKWQSQPYTDSQIAEFEDDQRRIGMMPPYTEPVVNLSKMYCNRDPITGKCDGDPRGHLHPF